MGSYLHQEIALHIRYKHKRRTLRIRGSEEKSERWTKGKGFRPRERGIFDEMKAGNDYLSGLQPSTFDMLLEKVISSTIDHMTFLTTQILLQVGSHTLLDS